MRVGLNLALSALTSALLGAFGCTIITVGSTATDGSAGTTTDTDPTGDTGTTGTTGTNSEGSDTATQGSNSGTQGTSVGTQGTSEGTTDTGTSTTGAETTGAETTGELGCDGGCGAGEYCDWSANSCGSQRSDVGTCKPVPDACDAEYAPVCGCDGEVHSNACTANGAGTDVAAAGGCLPPAEYFDCGYRFCDQGSSYCQVSYNDVQGEPDFYECLQLPEACGKEQVCGCLEGEPCFEFECSDDAGLTLYCPGG